MDEDFGRKERLMGDGKRPRKGKLKTQKRGG
jgi:hypothetical protein